MMPFSSSRASAADDVTEAENLRSKRVRVDQAMSFAERMQWLAERIQEENNIVPPSSPTRTWRRTKN